MTTTNHPTVAERIDPTSPHFDAAFAELRRKAYGAWDAHQKDCQLNPTYREASDKITGARKA